MSPLHKMECHHQLAGILAELAWALLLQSERTCDLISGNGRNVKKEAEI